jgi:hypothetical protein
MDIRRPAKSLRDHGVVAQYPDGTSVYANAGEISFSNQQRPPVRSIEIGAVDRAAEVGNEHSTAVHQFAESDSLFGFSPFISLSSSAVI